MPVSEEQREYAELVRGMTRDQLSALTGRLEAAALRDGCWERKLAIAREITAEKPDGAS